MIHRITPIDRRPTALGLVEYVYVERADGGRCTFSELREALDTHGYAGRAAVMYLPPTARFFDQVNRYHLFLLSEGEAASGLDLFDPAPTGTERL